MTNNDRQCATDLYEWNTTQWRSPQSDGFVQTQMSSVNITDEYIRKATEPDSSAFSLADILSTELLKEAFDKENTII